MIKNNLFNRLFRAKQLAEQANFITKIKTLYPIYRKRVEKAKTLREVFELHKDAWWKGFRNVNLGPDKFGMFRTDDIGCMSPSEVYLGGIYGLLTKTLPEWENYKNTKLGPNGFGIDPDTPLYSVILNQYKSHLKSNLKTIYETYSEIQHLWYSSFVTNRCYNDVLICTRTFGCSKCFCICLHLFRRGQPR